MWGLVYLSDFLGFGFWVLDSGFGFGFDKTWFLASQRAFLQAFLQAFCLRDGLYAGLVTGGG
jgi:hypothetical protein